MIGKVALVTGGAQGLGRAFSEVLLKHGAKVCIADVNKRKGLETTTNLQEKYGKDAIHFISCDCAQDEQVRGTFSEATNYYGPLDIVVNNAGIADEKNWQKTIKINFNAVILGTILAHESMRKDKGGNGGHIINVASMAGVTGVNYAPVYAATKHGVVGISRSLGDTAMSNKLGVSVNCLCPAFTRTDILNFSQYATDEYSALNAEKAIKLLGVMEIEQVANAFEHILISGKSGTVLMVTKALGQMYLPDPFERPTKKPGS